MNTEHPITPPPELVQQWCHEDGDEIKTSPRWFHSVCAKAARWGAEQELEACCQHVDWVIGGLESKELRAARRPKPPSLKEQALGALGRFNTNTHTRADEMAQDFDLIRRALEALPNE